MRCGIRVLPLLPANVVDVYQLCMCLRLCWGGGSCAADLNVPSNSPALLKCSSSCCAFCL